MILMVSQQRSHIMKVAFEEPINLKWIAQRRVKKVPKQHLVKITIIIQSKMELRLTASVGIMRGT